MLIVKLFQNIIIDVKVTILLGCQTHQENSNYPKEYIGQPYCCYNREQSSDGKLLRKLTEEYINKTYNHPDGDLHTDPTSHLF